jgi:hypothetical protein
MAVPAPRAQRFSLADRRRFPAVYCLQAVYAVLVVALLGATPLWLDEVIQLGASRDPAMQRTLHWIATNPGGSPLPPLFQNLWITVLGYSTFAARASAALCGILSCIAFVPVLSRLGVRRIWIGLLLFMALPLQFRYALEARGYSQGILFTVLALWLFLRLRERASLGVAIAYGAALAAGLYSQPFTVFPALAQLAVALAPGFPATVRKRVAGAAAAAAAAFLPWLLFQTSVRHADPQASVYFFSFAQISGLKLLHELAGGGYVCAIALLALAACGALSAAAATPHTRLLVATAALALIGPLCADASFGYFFAGRQFAFAMPALVALAIRGSEALIERGRAVASALLLVAFLASSAVADRAIAIKPKDDLARTAATLAQLPSAGCILAVPRSAFSLYAFFQPELKSRACGAPAEQPRDVVLVCNQWTPENQQAEASAALEKSYTHGRTLLVGKSVLLLYHQR